MLPSVWQFCNPCYLGTRGVHLQALGTLILLIMRIRPEPALETNFEHSSVIYESCVREVLPIFPGSLGKAQTPSEKSSKFTMRKPASEYFSAETHFSCRLQADTWGENRFNGST